MHVCGHGRGWRSGMGLEARRTGLDEHRPNSAASAFI